MCFTRGTWTRVFVGPQRTWLSWWQLCYKQWTGEMNRWNRDACPRAVLCKSRLWWDFLTLAYLYRTQIPWSGARPRLIYVATPNLKTRKNVWNISSYGNFNRIRHVKIDLQIVQVEIAIKKETQWRGPLTFTKWLLVESLDELVSSVGLLLFC